VELANLTGRALAIHDLYDELNRRQHGRVWSRSDYVLGFMGDVGDLAKLVMAEEGLREAGGGRAALEHELADCLWSGLILAEWFQDLAVVHVRTRDAHREGQTGALGDQVDLRPVLAAIHRIRPSSRFPLVGHGTTRGEPFAPW
jgi:NTP pyrophosphatase (non-canonical NTP hydrolase)